MKKHRPVKHAHRRAMIAERKSRGRYSRCDLPKPETCRSIEWCQGCWAASYLGKRKDCLKPWCNTEYYKNNYGG